MCFFFVSRYMDEENQWGSEIKKTKTSKKNILSFIHQLHPATTALPGCPHDQSLSQRCIIWHLNVAPVQGREECEEKKPHFPRQISIFLSPSTRQRSCTTAVSACNERQRKNENSPVHKHMAAQNVVFCVFFSCVFFFLELGKSMSACNEKQRKNTPWPKNKSMQLHTSGSVTAEFQVRHRWLTTMHSLFRLLCTLRWTRACSLSPEARSFWLALQPEAALFMHMFVDVQCSTSGWTLEDKTFSNFSADWRWQRWRTWYSAVTAFIAKKTWNCILLFSCTLASAHHNRLRSLQCDNIPEILQVWGNTPSAWSPGILANRPDLVGTIPIWRPKPDDTKKPIRPNLSRSTVQNHDFKPAFSACSLSSSVEIQVSSVSFGHFSCTRLWQAVIKKKKNLYIYQALF